MTEATGSQNQPSQPSKAPWEQAWNDIKSGLESMGESVKATLPKQPPNPSIPMPWERLWSEPKAPPKPKKVKQEPVTSGIWEEINAKYAAGQGERDKSQVHLLRDELAREKDPKNRETLKREISRVTGFPGMMEQGNIDLDNRPMVKNKDGSISTVRSIGVSIDGEEVLIPTVSDDGKLLTDKQAIDLYRRTGKHLGKFSSPESSTVYAEKLHLDQEKKYVKRKS